MPTLLYLRVYYAHRTVPQGVHVSMILRVYMPPMVLRYMMRIVLTVIWGNDAHSAHRSLGEWRG